MALDVKQIQELRQRTGVSISDCKKALEESKGNIDKALEVLKKRGIDIARAKADRATKEGKVEAYIHFSGKIGVLVEVGCETDFVAKNSDFIQFCKNLAMHIAAKNPTYIREEDMPKDELKDVKDKKTYIEQHCLLNQVYIKDEKMTVKDYLESMVAKVGENLIVNRFCYFKVGEK